MTIDQLNKFLPKLRHPEVWYSQINRLLPINEINTPQRIAAFVAQCAHESAGFSRLEENLKYTGNGLRRVFPKYFPTDELARQYELQPQKIANKVYGNRMGNGPEESGEGWKYRGRGLIQLTGKNNYIKCGRDIGLDLANNPDLLLYVSGAIKSALWYWKKNELNHYADEEDIEGMTKIINGGFNGLEHRKELYSQAISILENKL